MCRFFHGFWSFVFRQLMDMPDILGHASIVTTQIYARMVDARTRASVEALSYGA